MYAYLFLTVHITGVNNGKGGGGFPPKTAAYIIHIRLFR